MARGLSSCGSRVSLLRSMWDLPGPGLEPVSPALADGFLTTAPPGKSRCRVYFQPFAHCVAPPGPGPLIHSTEAHATHFLLQWKDPVPLLVGSDTQQAGDVSKGRGHLHFSRTQENRAEKDIPLRGHQPSPD